jgi:hypothetical protein
VPSSAQQQQHQHPQHWHLSQQRASSPSSVLMSYEISRGAVRVDSRTYFHLFCAVSVLAIHADLYGNGMPGNVRLQLHDRVSLVAGSCRISHRSLCTRLVQFRLPLRRCHSAIFAHGYFGRTALTVAGRDRQSQGQGSGFEEEGLAYVNTSCELTISGDEQKTVYFKRWRTRPCVRRGLQLADEVTSPTEIASINGS